MARYCRKGHTAAQAPATRRLRLYGYDSYMIDDLSTDLGTAPTCGNVCCIVLGSTELPRKKLRRFSRDTGGWSMRPVDPSPVRRRAPDRSIGLAESYLRLTPTRIPADPGHP